MSQWYKKSYFRNLVDMHIPSGEQNLENFDAEKYAECMAIAGVAVFPIMCIYPFFQKYFAKGLMVGAVKG